jgi:type II secretory pathway predicted ATPase ExeA
MNPNIHTSICEHFKLSKIPFLHRTKVAFNYDLFEDNLSFLSTVFYSRQVAVVSGPPGSGKTPLIFYALNDLDPAEFRVVSCELSNPSKGAFYKTLATKMGLNPNFRADDVKLQIINFFNEENAQGKFNCVICDEAHSLSINMIDELRSFYDEGKNFSLILSGLPALINRKLNLSLTIPMKQRVSLFLECSGFSLNELQDYVKHQLQQANAKNPIFDEKCFPILHSETSGIARKVNQACYGALLECYRQDKSIITEDILKKVLDKVSYN